MRHLLVLLLAAILIVINGLSVTAVIPPPNVLNTNAASDSGDDYLPQLATDGAGNWVGVWQSLDSLGGTIGSDLDILVSTSSDDGATWSPPSALNTNAGSDSGNDFEPQIATDGLGAWLVIWRSTTNLGGTIGTDDDILYSRSTDNGSTWSAPAALNSNAATDSGNDISPVLAVDAAGNWIAAWSSRDDLGGTVGIDADIFFSRSTDAGVTWSPVGVINQANADAGHDNAPSLAANGAGGWVAVWESNDTQSGTIGSDYDILRSVSTDGGATWGVPSPLNSNAATDSGDDTAPHVAFGASGVYTVAWTSTDTLGGTIGADVDIIVSRSINGGLGWSPPAALSANAAGDSGSDTEPHVSWHPASATWIAVWRSDDTLGLSIGSDSDILLSNSPDGATWSSAAALASNAASDSGEDWSPVVVSSANGTVLTAWSSTETFGGAIGTDFDIVYSDCPPLTTADGDGDGVRDACDICPATANAGQEDADADGIGDACDTEGPSPNTNGLGGANDCTDGVDNDGDTLTDGDEPACADADGDLVSDVIDNCPNDPNPSQSDVDGDGIGDACDTEGPSPNTNGLGGADDCVDGVDNDGDTLADGSDPGCDSDGDGVADIVDNCPSVANPGQADLDGDGIGDHCDDSDGDGFTDYEELTIGTLPLQACPSTTTADDEDPDAWPPDFNDDTEVTISDVLAIKPVFNTTVPPSSARYDIAVSGAITISDVLAIKPYFNLICS